MFGLKKGFARTNNASSNAPFGTNPFGAATTTGTNPFGTTTAASGTNPFGITTATGTNAFGTTTTIGTNPFGMTATNGTNPFGMTIATGTNVFGTTTPASTNPFGTTTASGTNVLGTTTPVSTNPFGTTANSSTNAFGTTTPNPNGTNPFGAITATGTHAFGTTTLTGTNPFGMTTATGTNSLWPTTVTGTNAFGTTTATGTNSGWSTVFGRPCSQDFLSGSATLSSKSSSPFVNSGPFQSGPSNTGTYNPFGNQNSQSGGSRIKSYKATAMEGEPKGKLLSISAMPLYSGKSHEELRWEDCQLRTQGANGSFASFMPSNVSKPLFSADQSSKTSLATFPFSNPTSKTTTAFAPFPQTNATSSTSVLGLTTTPFNTSPFANHSTLNANQLTNQTSTATSFPSQTNNCSSILTNGTGNGLTSFNPFSNQTSSAPSYLSSFNTCSGSSSGTANGMTNYNSFTNQASTASSFPSFFQTSNVSSSVATGTANGLTNINAFSKQGLSGPLFPSTFQPINGNFTSSSNQVAAQNPGASIFPSPFQPSNSVFSSGTSEKSLNFTYPFFPQKQPESAQTSGPFSIATSFQFPANNGQSNSASQISMAKVEIVPVKDPFGIEQKIYQSSSNHAKSALFHQSGISSMPVKVERPVSIRVSSLLTTARHVSHSRITIKKVFQTKNTCQRERVPFFSHKEDDGVLTMENHPVPRVNIRSVLLTDPTKVWCEGSAGKKTSEKACSKTNISSSGNEVTTITPQPTEDDDKHQLTNQAGHWKESHATATNLVKPTEGESKIPAEEITPKLQRTDYYTEPSISQLLLKEDSMPGYMSRVGGLIIGQHEYGYIEFEGETDVRGLDLDSLVIFNAGEVIVYAEGADKPPVGEGLNKPALITLLNVKCINKKTGERFVEGKVVERFEEKLKRAADKQGAEFVSYDPVTGEWKFRVDHF